MLFKNIAVLDENYDTQNGMYVGTLGDKIAYLSKEPPADEKLYGESYDGKNKLLLPGFCNAHSHMPMAFLRCYGEGVPLQSWLNDYIFPFEAKLTDEDVRYGCLLSVAEALRFGITSCTEMYLHPEGFIKAFVESGIKTNYCVNLVHFGDDPLEKNPVYPEIMKSLNEYSCLENGRVLSELCIHALYTSTPAAVRSVAELAKQYNKGVHVHVAETAAEVAGCIEKYGVTPVEYFNNLGLFDTRTTAAHCVHVIHEDIEILYEKGVTVAANPKSNLKLASGISPVKKLISRGVNIAIGTDSVSSNNNLNMLEEIRFFALLQKVRENDASAVTPKQAFFAASRAGYLGQGRNDCGLVKEGYKADLCVYDLDRPYMRPCHDLLTNMLYSANGSDVCLTMVDGRVLYRDGQYFTIDLERVYAEVDKTIERIKEEIGK